MSKLKIFVGIDISKLWFDAALIKSDNPSEFIHRQFAQNATGYKTLLEWLSYFSAMSWSLPNVAYIRLANQNATSPLGDDAEK